MSTQIDGVRSASQAESPISPGFATSPQMADCLQRVLVDLIALTLNVKQAHWNVVGPNFRGTHLLLDEIVDAVQDYTDTIAERMRALSLVPDGRPMTVVESTSLADFPSGERNTTEVVGQITDRIRRAVVTVRAVHDQVDAEDPSTTDLLHTVIGGLEKYAWLLYAETAAVGNSAG